MGQKKIVGDFDIVGNITQNGSPLVISGITYLTTAPSADNTDGDLKFVILDHEPATYYNGYYYIITESAQAQSNDGGTGGGSN